MVQRYLNRIPVLQLKPTSAFKYGYKSAGAVIPTSAFKHGAKSAGAVKSKFTPTSASEDDIHTVKPQVRPTPSKRLSNVADILASDARQDRALLYTIDPSGHISHTQVIFRNYKDKNGVLVKGKASMTFNFKRNRRNADTVLQAASTLARLLERWPHALNFNPKEKITLVDVAFELGSTHQSKLYPDIEFDVTKSIYFCSVRGIDPDSGSSYSVYLQVHPAKITNFEVPKTPETEKFSVKQVNPQGNSYNLRLATKGRTTDEARKHRAATDILRLALWKYHSKILRYSDVKQAVEEMVQRHAESH